MNKRVIIIVLFFILILLVSACSNSQGENAQNNTGAEQSEQQGNKTDNEAVTDTETVQKDNPFKIGTEYTQEEVSDFIRIDEQLYEQFFELTEEGPIIPALLQDYVPQGITLLEDQNWIVISNYSSKEGKPTILVVIDNNTGEFIKVFELYNADNTPYTGHAGGITAGKSYLWVASGSKVRRLKIDDLVNGTEPRLTFGKEFEVDSRASFVFEQDGILWVGDYAYGTKYPTPETHYIKNREGQQYKGWIAGYELDESTEDIASSIPNYILSIPDQTQGMVMMNDKIILSQSYGRNNPSTLLLYENNLKDEPHSYVKYDNGEEVPIWFLDGKNKVGELVMPPMSETLVSDMEKLYILFESGANVYRVSGSYPLLRIQTMKRELIDSISIP